MQTGLVIEDRPADQRVAGCVGGGAEMDRLAPQEEVIPVRDQQTIQLNAGAVPPVGPIRNFGKGSNCSIGKARNQPVFNSPMVAIGFLASNRKTGAFFPFLLRRPSFPLTADYLAVNLKVIPSFSLFEGHAPIH